MILINSFRKTGRQENKMDPHTDDYLKITKQELKENYNEIKICNVPIWRRNIQNKLVTIPIDRLDYYLGGENKEEIIFYIEKDWRSRIKGDVKKNHEQDFPMEKVEKYGNVEDQVKKFKMVSIVRREEILDRCIERFDTMESRNNPIDINAVLNMVEVVANTFYANYANLEDNMDSPNLKGILQGVYGKTEWAVDILIKLFSKKDIYNYRDFNIIDKISTGSYTMDHMNKVFLRFVIFCLFYNDYIANGLINRGDFKQKYLRYYKKKFPDEENLNVERVFKGGMRRIDLKTELKAYAIGALLYDIGKILEIKYHDSSDNYNESLIKKHVLYGFNMIIKAKGYPFVVAAMAAFHHEYYSSSGSYKFVNPIISKVTTKKRSDDNALYFMTYNENEFKEGIAIAFFPCKILEIIDVYDALTTKRKKSCIEALTIMKKEFIIKQLKIDPILYDIFVAYLMRCGLIDTNERNMIDSMIY